MLAHHFLEFFANNIPDAPCVTFEESSLSYGDIGAKADRMANALLDLGVKPGQRIAILSENCPEHFMMFMAASKVGAVSVPLNYRLAPAELAFTINDSNAKVLFALDGVETILEALRASLASDVSLITRDQAESIHLDDWLSKFPNTSPRVEVDRDAPYIQLYTSGTTGNPKGVVITHFNILQEAAISNAGFTHRPDKGSAGLICAPMFHIAGAGSVVTSIYQGQHVILHPTFDPMKVLDDIEAYPITNLFMVPAMIMFVLQIPGIEKRDFSDLVTIAYGASPISETVLREAMEVFQCEFAQMYGMTETTGMVACLTPEDHTRALAGRPEILRSCGRASIGVEIKVMDTSGQEVPNGEVGEIRVKSDTNMVGYYNLPDITASELTDGWVHTGDAGYIDDEGYVYLKDRIKDMVVSGGENIYPVEVENALAKHQAIADVAVIGVPDEKFGEALLAFVVTKPDMTLEVDEMIEFCRDKIAGYKIPRQLELIDELPRNPSGKILKKILRQPYWENTDRAIG